MIGLLVIGAICSYVFIFNNKLDLEISKDVQQDIKYSGKLHTYDVSFKEDVVIKETLPELKKYVSHIEIVKDKKTDVFRVTTTEAYVEIIKDKLKKEIKTVSNDKLLETNKK